jgi:hypothetical protein
MLLLVFSFYVFPLVFLSMTPWLKFLSFPLECSLCFVSWGRSFCVVSVLGFDVDKRRKCTFVLEQNGQ